MIENEFKDSSGRDEANPSSQIAVPQPSLLTETYTVLLPGRHNRLFLCDGEARRPGDCDIVFYQKAYLRIVEHLMLDTTREHGGLLLGHIAASYDVGAPTIHITHALPAQHTKGTSGSLTFTEETWITFQEDLEELGRRGVMLQRLGWYHSHPNWGVFLSRWDIDVCTNFSQPTHVALVVDPIKKLGGFFVNGREGYRPRMPQGFWEFPDIGNESVVDWKNLKVVGLDGGLSAAVISVKPIADSSDEPAFSQAVPENLQAESLAESVETSVQPQDSASKAEEDRDEPGLLDGESSSEIPPAFVAERSTLKKPPSQFWRVVALGVQIAAKLAKVAVAVIFKAKKKVESTADFSLQMNEASPVTAPETVPAARQIGNIVRDDQDSSNVANAISVIEDDDKAKVGGIVEASPRIRVLS